MMEGFPPGDTDVRGPECSAKPRCPLPGRGIFPIPVSCLAIHLLFPSKSEQRWHMPLCVLVTNIPLMSSRTTADPKPTATIAQPRPC